MVGILDGLASTSNLLSGKKELNHAMLIVYFFFFFAN